MKIQANAFAIPSLLMVFFFLTSCSGNKHEEETKKDNPVPVVVAVAGKQTGDNIYASGQIESKETAAISTRVMGFITSIKVNPGDQVQKRQLLVTISDGDIQAKKAQAQAMVSEAEAALKDAEKDYKRFEELYKQQSASTKEFENAELHYNSIKAKTEAARQMQNEAEAMLAYTNLTAPISGVIIQKNMDAGSMANPGMPILVIEQTGGYQISASVSEADIASIKEGADAEVVIKSSGRIIKGKVSEISPSSQFSGGQYIIKVSIPDAEKNGLYSGMYVNVSITSSGLPTASGSFVLVPASAIIYKDQLIGIYIVSESQTALLRWIKAGKIFGDKVEILSGLRPDEKFILASEGKLYNGVPVIEQ
ncbi:MAG: efflux RND transporter periplasmic adaptor subunit [Chitinophagales bacterium]|nr:efflux RND transporter periplasmic adaptor subunit [Chitinophagales bacterium]